MELKPTMQHTVIGLLIPNRFKQAGDVQEILTKYGCSIKTRLGLHETNKDYCATNGLLLLEMYGKEEEMIKMVEELKAIDGGLDVQQMIFKQKN